MAELFEILDEDGTPLGTAPRAQAHSEGLWHRASNVFVFLSNSTLLIQQRHLTKDIYPGAWDVSAAEHLKPGETFEQGALRGLEEELGIEGVAVEPIGGVTKYQLDFPSANVKDYEFQQSFRVTYSGPIRPNPREVLSTRSIELRDLRLEMQRQPDAFTPWFRERAEDLRIFQAVV